MNKPKCKCGKALELELCCQPFLDKRRLPDTAEALMRSRFSAYCLGFFQYILDTYHHTTRPNCSAHELQQSVNNLRWLFLDVINTGIQGEYQFVEFKAYLSEQSQIHCIHEVSRFVCENEQWLYIDGEFKSEHGRIHIGRNDTCFCKSGLKFKKCCGKS